MKLLIAAHIRWHNAEAEYIHRLARGLVRRGHQVTIWGLPGSPLLERAQADGITTMESPSPGSLRPASLGPMLARLREALDQQPDLVDVHRSEGFVIIAHEAKKRGIPVIRTRGDMRLPRLPAVNRRVYGMADRIITANDLLREELLIRLGLPPDRMTTVHFGINPAEVKPARPAREVRKELGLKETDRVAAVMGRLGKVKGHEFVLKAAEKVVEAVPDLKFMVLYRDVEDSDEFLPMLRQSRLRDRFILVSPRSGHVDVMQLAEAAIIPSVGSEAHCRVALEWMALGVPLIGSRVGVIPEIIVHGETGYLVQPRYAETIAHCLVELFRDPARARAMGEAGRRRLEAEFAEEKMVDDHLAAYRQIAANKTRTV